MSDNLVLINKFTERTVSCDRLTIQKRIEFLSRLDYSVTGFQRPEFDKSLPIFTIILTIHDSNIKFIEESLYSVLNQTYTNTEVIIIDHGTSGLLKSTISNVLKSKINSKVKLLRKDTNVYNPSADDFSNQIVNLWHAGLFCSEGDYVYFLACDDKLSLNYVGKMVSLFRGNPMCCSAAPLVISIDENGEVNEQITENLRSNNCRPKYTNGVVLASNLIDGGNMICSPGGLLALKTNLVYECGGFDTQSDLSQFFKFAINGDSGFDSDAILYWRHHKDQTNQLQSKQGLVYYKAYMAFCENYGINELHERVVGKDFADKFQRYWNKRASMQAIYSFRVSYQCYGLASGYRALVNICKECTYRELSSSLFYMIVDSPRMFYNNYTPKGVQQLLKYLGVKQLLKYLKYRLKRVMLR